MSGDVVAREHAQEFVLGIENGVEEEQRTTLGKERDAFHLVFIARIADGAAESGILVEHEAVIDAHRFHGGATRQNGLAAAAVAREVVVHDGARQNDVIDVAQMLVDPHGSAAARRAEVFEVFVLGGGAVVHLQARGNFFAYGFDHFLMRHVAVRAQREDDVHVFVLDAELVEFIDEHRHEVVAVCHARRIVADEGHRIARLDDLVDRFTSDRVVDSIKHALLDVTHRREFFGADFLDDKAFVNGKLFAAAAVGKIVGLHFQDQ